MYTRRLLLLVAPAAAVASAVFLVAPVDFLAYQLSLLCSDVLDVALGLVRAQQASGRRSGRRGWISHALLVGVGVVLVVCGPFAFLFVKVPLSATKHPLLHVDIHAHTT